MMPTDRAALEKLRQRHRAGLLSVGAALTREAKKRLTKHVDLGTYRNAITTTDTSNGQRLEVFWGVSLKTAPHARYLETGFTPHWVPGRYVGLWAQRHGVGTLRQTRARTGRGRSRLVRRYKTTRAVALGVFVGGPGSTLDWGGIPSMMQFRGRRRVRILYKPTGGGEHSPYLERGKVGYSVIRWTVRERLREVHAAAYVRGYQRGR